MHAAFLSTLLPLLALSASATVFRVDAERPDDSGDGLTWATAMKTIQAGVDAASDEGGGEVWVKGGAYVEGVVMKSDVALYGGFAGTETARDDRDWKAHRTTIDASGAAGVYNVVQMIDIDHCRVDGFGLTGGNRIGSSDTQIRGGGIYGDGAGDATVIANCEIYGNAKKEGGGVYLADSGTAFYGCTIRNNTATGTAGIGGAGVKCDSSSCVFETCIIVNNAVTAYFQLYGGGVFLDNQSSVAFRDCLVVGNTVTDVDGGADALGGGLCCGRFHDSEATLENCIIAANSSSGRGGGLALLNEAIVSLSSCTFAGNRGLSGASGILAFDDDTNATLHNCALADHTQVALYETGASADITLTNCLVFGNPDGDLYDEGSTLLTGADAVNALVDCEGNVDGDPMFLMDGPHATAGSWTADPTYDATAKVTTFTTAPGSLVSGELAGLLVNPNRSQHLYLYVLDNTDDSLVVWGDKTALASAGDAFVVADYRLSGESAAIDVGTDADAPSTDIDGNPRPVDYPSVGVDGTGTEYDIGAYEMPAPPHVASILCADPNPTAATEVRFTVTFSEDVTGVSEDDFALASAGPVGATVTGVSSDEGSIRDVSVHTGDGDGTLRLNFLDDDDVLGAGFAPVGGPGPGNGDYEGDETYIIDRTPPEVVSVTASEGQVGRGTLVTIWLETTEAPSSVPVVRVNGRAAAWVETTDATHFVYEYIVADDDPFGAAGVHVELADAAGNPGSYSGDLFEIIPGVPILGHSLLAALLLATGAAAARRRRLGQESADPAAPFPRRAGV